MMPSSKDSTIDETQPFKALFDMPFFDMQGEAMRAMFAGAMPGKAGQSADAASGFSLPEGLDAGDLGEWAKAGAELQQMWVVWH